MEKQAYSVTHGQPHTVQNLMSLFLNDRVDTRADGVCLHDNSPESHIVATLKYSSLSYEKSRFYHQFSHTSHKEMAWDINLGGLVSLGMPGTSGLLGKTFSGLSSLPNIRMAKGHHDILGVPKEKRPQIQGLDLTVDETLITTSADIDNRVQAKTHVHHEIETMEDEDEQVMNLAFGTAGSFGGMFVPYLAKGETSDEDDAISEVSESDEEDDPKSSKGFPSPEEALKAQAKNRDAQKDKQDQEQAEQAVMSKLHDVERDRDHIKNQAADKIQEERRSKGIAKARDGSFWDSLDLGERAIFEQEVAIRTAMLYQQKAQELAAMESRWGAKVQTWASSAGEVLKEMGQEILRNPTGFAMAAAYEMGDIVTPGGLDATRDLMNGKITKEQALGRQLANIACEGATGYVAQKAGKAIWKGMKGTAKILGAITKKAEGKLAKQFGKHAQDILPQNLNAMEKMERRLRHGGKATNVADYQRLKRDLLHEQQLGEIKSGNFLNPDKKLGDYIIAGNGSKNKVLQDAPRLATQYGGNPSDWAMKSSNAILNKGETIEVHAYKNMKTGQMVEPKNKIQIPQYMESKK